RVAEQAERHAQDVVTEERSKSGLAKLIRGGKLKDAEYHLAHARDQHKAVTEELTQVTKTLRDYQQAIVDAPTKEVVATQGTRLQTYQVAVQALDNPQVVRAEHQWREQASLEVMQADQRRRNPHEASTLAEVMAVYDHSGAAKAMRE